MMVLIIHQIGHPGLKQTKRMADYGLCLGAHINCPVFCSEGQTISLVVCINALFISLFITRSYVWNINIISIE